MRFKSLEDHGPFLLIGGICWLCAAVIVGIGVTAFISLTAGLVAVTVSTLLVLILFWKLGSATTIRIENGENR